MLLDLVTIMHQAVLVLGYVARVTCPEGLSITSYMQHCRVQCHIQQALIGHVAALYVIALVYGKICSKFSVKKYVRNFHSLLVNIIWRGSLCCFLSSVY